MGASPAAWLDDDQQQLWQALLTVVISLPAVLDRQLQRDAGMSNFEYGVLARLSAAEDATIRMGELARACDSPLPRLSKVMDRFERRGWVTRRPDPRDGRFTLATLNEQGHRKVTDAAPCHVAQVRRLVLDPLTHAQRRQLTVGLGLVADTLRRELGSGPTG